MNEVSIIINGVRYDAVDFPYKSAPNKCESCEIFDHCFQQGKEEMKDICSLAEERGLLGAAKRVVFKYSTKKFEK